MHFHYALFSEILRDLARTAASVLRADVAHREALLDGAKALASALEGNTARIGATHSVCWVARESGGLKSLQRSDEGRCIQRQG
jgi:hypothetical protein